jgi:hypothetical protein
MPQKYTNKKFKQSTNAIEGLFKLFFEAFFMPIFRISKSLILIRPVTQYKYHRNIVIDCLGLAILLVLLIFIGGGSLFGHSLIILRQIAVVIIVILIISLFIFLFRTHRISFSSVSKKDPSLDVYNKLHEALEIMDKTANYYNDENEANRALVSILKAQNISAFYQYRLLNGRIADAKVMDVLVEGKLSPNTAEVDGLIGTFEDYTRYRHKLFIVIYGKLSDDAKRRIDNEIHCRYLNRIYLVVLPNPRRLRVNN